MVIKRYSRGREESGAEGDVTSRLLAMICGFIFNFVKRLLFREIQEF